MLIAGVLSTAGYINLIITTITTTNPIKAKRLHIIKILLKLNNKIILYLFVKKVNAANCLIKGRQKPYKAPDLPVIEAKAAAQEIIPVIA